MVKNVIVVARSFKRISFFKLCTLKNEIVLIHEVVLFCPF